MPAKAEALRSSLRDLEGLLEDYSPLMSTSEERFVDTTLKYGGAIAAVSSPTPT